jgi:hypothetical protein
MTERISVVLTRAAYVQGDPHAEGTRLRLPAAAAWEAVTIEGFARFQHEADLERALAAFVAEQTQLLARLNGSRAAGGLQWGR